jgi:hypothetical protein
MSEPQSPQTPQPPQPPREGSKGASPSKYPAWIVGGVLILVGIIFIVKNVSGFELHNWWALFILIPALASLGTAYTMYRKNEGRFTAASRGPLIGGLVLLFVAGVFLFDLDWGAMWPVLLIIVGAGTLLSVLDRK